MLTPKGLLAVVLGGIALFLWGGLTHIVLPFYNNSLNRFSNEDEVARAITSNVPKSGTYFIPNFPPSMPNASSEEKEASMKAMEEKMKQGPLVYAHVRAGGLGSLSGYYLVQVLTDLVAAFVVAFLLSNSKSTTLKSRLMMSAGVGTLVVVVSSIPEWNWYGAGPDHLLAEAIDHIIGWTVTGFVIAKMLPPGEQKAV